MDKISIVVAVYNAEKYLNKCIDSLLNQTYENTEIILVNDFSKDGSLDICLRYEQKYNNIIVVNNSHNMGVSSTRNNGIDASTGKYICFVDSDDYVEPNYLEQLYFYYQKYNTVPICGFVYHDEFNHMPPKKYTWSNGNELVSLGQAFKLNAELYLTALWNKLLNNKIVKDFNIRFDSSISIGEDLKFSLDYFEKSNISNVYAFSDTLYHYTKQSDNNLMSKISFDDINKSFDRLHIIQSLAQKFNDYSTQDYTKAINKLKEYYIYLIVKDKKISLRNQYHKIKSFCDDYNCRRFMLDKLKYIKASVALMLKR